MSELRSWHLIPDS